MVKGCLLFLLFVTSTLCIGQRTYPTDSLSTQFELRHDNDFFTLTDRYYSSGLYLIYRKKLGKGFFTENEQLDFQLGQEVYTPAQTQSTNPDEFDRPYAGFLGLRTSWSIAKGKQLFSTDLLLGIAGPNSGAGGFQRWYHRTIAISDGPLWIQELNDSFHLNLYGSYVKEWTIAPNPFGVRIALNPTIAVGSRDVFAESEAILFFGRRNSIGQSIAYNRIGSNEREIYFSLRFGYRQVFWNGLIEGNGFSDDSPVLGEIENSLLRLGFDFNHRFDRNDYKVGVRYNSKETPEARNHIYFQLSYALSF
ncbi:lipid A-modifier LpxR family protein [Croceivirga thetidis]|uniref:Lipid A deacylase LpxR family protein n=1 Tax=Croceivirga thetidis TaxID=2721623 RepID=A0ABX1GRM5_9FLAO|nr:lipid A-modifier LpxR family protein [Croceivirga thetidis]NKI31575.1 lipid A deacylase LpxR family protein [Croceivirga thetidis]